MERKPDTQPDPKSAALGGLTGPDRKFFDTAWELAVNYREVGRLEEAADFFLVAAALLERNGQTADSIYRTVLELDDDNAVAASRLEPEARRSARTDIFVSHVLCRHSFEQAAALLSDERARQWVTPPRGEQVTCTECGMGVPAEDKVCQMCGARVGSTYRKRATASYHLSALGAQQQPADSASPAAPESPNETPGRQSPQEPRPTLAILSPDGTSPPVAQTQEKEVLIGTDPGCFGSRLEIEADGVQARHARIRWDDSSYQVQDLGSQAGVFLVVRSPTVCRPGQVFQIGAQTLRLEDAPPGRGLTVSHLSGFEPRESTVYRSGANEIVFGRTEGTLTFPNDTYVSDPHARLAAENDGVSLIDLRSRWGTFLKLPPEMTLNPGSLIRVGRLLIELR